MILRLAAFVAAVLMAAAGLPDPAFGPKTVQEGMLRAKPAVVLVVAWLTVWDSAAEELVAKLAVPL